MPNGPVYEQLRGLSQNFASTHQAENSAVISKACPERSRRIGDNKQLLIAIVSLCFLFTSEFG